MRESGCVFHVMNVATRSFGTMSRERQVTKQKLNSRSRKGTCLENNRIIGMAVWQTLTDGLTQEWMLMKNKIFFWEFLFLLSRPNLMRKMFKFHAIHQAHRIGIPNPPVQFKMFCVKQFGSLNETFSIEVIWPSFKVIDCGRPGRLRFVNKSG